MYLCIKCSLQHDTNGFALRLIWGGLENAKMVFAELNCHVFKIPSVILICKCRVISQQRDPNCNRCLGRDTTTPCLWGSQFNMKNLILSTACWFQTPWLEIHWGPNLITHRLICYANGLIEKWMSISTGSENVTYPFTKRDILFVTDKLYSSPLIGRQDSSHRYTAKIRIWMYRAQLEYAWWYIIFKCRFINVYSPPWWRRGSGLDYGARDPSSIPGIPSPRVGHLMARTSRCRGLGYFGTLKIHGVGCPTAGLNLETGQLSRHYITEISLNVTLNNNKLIKNFNVYMKYM